MPMNNRILRPLARPLLLDAVPGAAAAYSVRQLRNSYTGPVVTVRRSSDNAEQDFKASEIDDGTLAAFCGAGDGLVKTWHDQSGSGNDASQGTAASQPKIVDSGTLVTEGGKPALEFDGVDDYFRRDMTAANQSYLAFVVYHHKAAFSVGGRLLCLNCNIAHTTAADVAAQSAGNDLKVLQQAIAFGTGSLAVNVGSSHLLYFTTGAGSASLRLYGNGNPSPSSSHDASPAGTGSFLAIMARADGASNTYGAVSELIIYPSDQSANRERIEGDINRHFGIF